MSVFPGSYIQTGMSSNARVNYIVDKILTPRMLLFRQIHIHDEQSVLQPDNVTWKNTFGNWNPTFPFIFRKNFVPIVTPSNINMVAGTYENGLYLEGDNMHVTYNFDYFPVDILHGFLLQAVDIINTAAVGSPTSYDLDSAPNYWDGVLADLAFALSMERLLLDYDVWYGKVVFAINGIEDSGDITGALETLKSNSEERAYKTLDNEKFKNGNLLSPPTINYYRAIRGFGRSGGHTGPFGYGKTRGIHNNKYI